MMSLIQLIALWLFVFKSIFTAHVFRVFSMRIESRKLANKLDVPVFWHIVNHIVSMCTGLRVETIGENEILLEFPLFLFSFLLLLLFFKIFLFIISSDSCYILFFSFYTYTYSMSAAFNKKSNRKWPTFYKRNCVSNSEFDIIVESFDLRWNSRII